MIKPNQISCVSHWPSFIYLFSEGDNKCISNEELQKNLTDRLRACDAALLDRTEEMKRQIVLLREQNTEGSSQSLSKQSKS